MAANWPSLPADIKKYPSLARNTSLGAVIGFRLPWRCGTSPVIR